MLVGNYIFQWEKSYDKYLNNIISLWKTAWDSLSFKYDTDAITSMTHKMEKNIFIFMLFRLDKE